MMSFGTPRLVIALVGATLLALAGAPPLATARSMKVCHRACEAAARACATGGERPSVCRRALLRHCKAEGPMVCFRVSGLPTLTSGAFVIGDQNATVGS